MGTTEIEGKGVTLEDIRQRLAGRAAVTGAPGSLRPAAVALVIRPGEAGPEVLYILRALWDDDPWSGNIAFPGGRIENFDVSPRAAAERETQEEVGIDLAGAEYLGQLDDLVGMTQPLVVSCFVYTVPRDTVMALSPEVAEAFWIGLDCMTEDRRHCVKEVIFNGRRYVKPAITLLPEGKPVLWGLTYRLTMQLLLLLGYPVDLDDGE